LFISDEVAEIVGTIDVVLKMRRVQEELLVELRDNLQALQAAVDEAAAAIQASAA
jgi:hypothetical protein